MNTTDDNPCKGCPSEDTEQECAMCPEQADNREADQRMAEERLQQAD